MLLHKAADDSPSISVGMRLLPVCITRVWVGYMCRDTAPLEAGKRCSKLSMTRRSPGFGNSDAVPECIAVPQRCRMDFLA